MFTLENEFNALTHRQAIDILCKTYNLCLLMVEQEIEKVQGKKHWTNLDDMVFGARINSLQKISAFIEDRLEKAGQIAVKDNQSETLYLHEVLMDLSKHINENNKLLKQQKPTGLWNFFRNRGNRH